MGIFSHARTHKHTHTRSLSLSQTHLLSIIEAEKKASRGVLNLLGASLKTGSPTFAFLLNH